MRSKRWFKGTLRLMLRMKESFYFHFQLRAGGRMWSEREFEVGQICQTGTQRRHGLGHRQTETHLPAEDGTPWWGCSCQSSSAWWRIWVHSILSSRNIVMMASRVVTASVMMNWNMKISLVVSSRNTLQTWMRIEKANRCQICPNLIPFQLYTATRYKSPLLVWSSRLF